MSKATKAKENVSALLDKYLAKCKKPPPELRLYRKQATTVRQSRQRHAEPLHTTDYLEFAHYKGIPISIYEDHTNE
jgi:hypothetical protein